MKLLTPKEAAKLLNVSFNTLARWRVEGRGPQYIKMENKTIRYAERDLLEYIKKNTVKGE